jgi:hypothetical protein
VRFSSSAFPVLLTLKGVGVPAAGHHKPDVPLLPET